jgi:patched 1 protein
MRDGLDMTDIVPKDAPEHEFLQAQAGYFGFYNIHAVTGGDFEYPGVAQQQLLQEFHDSFVRVSAVIKNDDGGLPPFWLSLFRDWLKGMLFKDSVWGSLPLISRGFHVFHIFSPA